MPRETVVGNGRLAVAFDGKMSLRDLFYPRVGLENHISGHEMRMGVWTDGIFSWLGEGWQMQLKYMPETMVNRCMAENTRQGIRIETNDAVHHSLDIVLRKVLLSNTEDKARTVRLFFTHDLHIYGDAVGDTVMYDPGLGVIVHYKRQRYFLINGFTSQRKGIHQFATGYKESLGREGTWKDAEDGLLEGNPIAQGSVDSAVSFQVEIGPKSTQTVYYWMACGRNLKDVMELEAKVKETGVEQLLLETENYWSAWLNKKEVDLHILPRDISRMFKTSLFIMRTHADSKGGIIASCDSDILQFNRDTYSYIWPRDGALAARAFDLAGFREVSSRFFLFCNKTVTEKGFFHHKYSPDGSVGSSWLAPMGFTGLPIEEDETALVLYALWKHFTKYRDIEFIESVYSNLVLKPTDFLLDYLDPETGLPKPSFDLWEEKVGTFTWTSSAVYSALKAAANLAKVYFHRHRYEILNKAAMRLKMAILDKLYDTDKQRFVRGLYPDGSPDPTVDSSICGIFLFGVLPASDERVENTMKAIVDHLWIGKGVGGLARYENDDYLRISWEVPGNPWFICTLWLARWYIARATNLDELKPALDILYWAARFASSSGLMAEQIHPFTGSPVSVSPLVWSHAEFVTAVCKYLETQKEISIMKNDISLDPKCT